MKYFLIPTIAVMFISYCIAFAYATGGYGYSGYHGYHSGPSFWYWSGTDYYPNRTARYDSASGNYSPYGRGPGSGK
jgi:hypothetical protein